MKAIIQRVTQASVTVDREIVGEIGKGYMILFGAAQGDTDADCEKLADKVSKLRIFSDENGKTNLSINDVGGDMLIVSQFTLLADCHHGNRPSFIGAGKPDEADRLYELFKAKCSEKISGKVEGGVFGAKMQVSLVNDGPFTILLECRNGEILA
jgi:D-tyrosyl-tRNA(Tyr) deacylase